MTHARRLTMCLGVTLTVLLAWPGRAVAQAPPDLTGLYRCEGINPDGSPYAGRVQITAEGKTWVLSWEFEHGGSGIGLGLWQAGVLAVIFKTNDGTLGVTAYVLTDGRLVGKWTVPGAGKVFTETLTNTASRVAAPAPGG